MIKFLPHDRSFTFSEKNRLRKFITKLFEVEGRKEVGAVQYIFCSDDYLLQINKQYLDHDFYTDIITFDLGGEEQVDADIYISIDRVKENAREYGQPYRRELLRVMFHGALHLCGYGDKTKREITLMREKEENYLRLFEYDNPQ